MCFNSNGKDDSIKEKMKEVTRRKKYKENLGSKYVNTILFDTKQDPNPQSSTKFCDIIVLAKDVSGWITHCTRIYTEKGLGMGKSALNGGKQYTFKDKMENTAFIHISIYKTRAR